ncbi:MAG: N-acetyltransferase [Chloroflexi bacterium]|nr:MAG: N-acetyltransferase [Chloroflexota bacterium]
MFIHDSATVETGADVGEGTKIWQICQIRSGASIGADCILGRGVFVDADVTIGNRVKIQNYVSVYTGVTIADGVFVGPHVCFTNDLKPRAVNPDMTLKSADDWTITPTRVEEGAAIGANSTIVCGVTIGRWAMIGAGSVVTKDVPAYTLVVGNPARQLGYVCACGNRKETLEAARDCTGCEQ